MPNTNWSVLNNMQLGKYGEYYAKMEFSSYGFEVYTSEVDDHGIDFIVKSKATQSFFEIQVKSIRQSGYVFMHKDKWNIDNLNTYLMLLLFDDGSLPDTYLIPAATWKNPDALFCDKDYDGLKSKPEYGINLSKKNMPIMQFYKFSNVIRQLMNSENSLLFTEDL